MSEIEEKRGQSAAKTASYERRADDWILQLNLAGRELMQIGQQILGSLVAEQIARREYQNIQKQMAQSEEVDRFLHEKFTREELYAWEQGERSRLYYEYYRFAFDTARKAELTMKRELMRPEVDDTEYVKFNYWDSGRKGLLSGEALYLDVKRMEMAYHENNKREYELTKHISLRQLDPLSLLTLKATGSCEVTLPEWLFDLDCPGTFKRRIITLSLSLPSVTGPFTSVNCVVTLLRSSLRRSPSLSLPDGIYKRQGSDDDRFVDYFGALQSVVTSSPDNDGGMFETNLRDERFLPFEGAGAESNWKLELPSEFRQFDYNTISDVILHMRYTARQGGAQLREKATEHLRDLVGNANQSGLALLFSLRHDFSTAWHQFATGNSDSNFTATIRRDHFPYFTQDKDVAIDGIELHAVEADQLRSHTPPAFDQPALDTMTTKLSSEEEFELSVAPDAQVLVPDTKAGVFMVIRYSVISV